MVVLNRDQILSADDMKTVKVKVPEWFPDGEVIVKSMTCAERDLWESLTFGDDGDIETKKRRIRATLLALTIVDEEGKLLFSVDDIDKLAEKSAKPMARLYYHARKLNLITSEDIDELKKN